MEWTSPQAVDKVNAIQAFWTQSPAPWLPRGACWGWRGASPPSCPPRCWPRPSSPPAATAWPAGPPWCRRARFRPRTTPRRRRTRCQRGYINTWRGVIGASRHPVPGCAAGAPAPRPRGLAPPARGESSAITTSRARSNSPLWPRSPDERRGLRVRRRCRRTPHRRGSPCGTGRGGRSPDGGARMVCCRAAVTSCGRCCLRRVNLAAMAVRVCSICQRSSAMRGSIRQPPFGHRDLLERAPV